MRNRAPARRGNRPAQTSTARSIGFALQWADNRAGLTPAAPPTLTSGLQVEDKRPRSTERPSGAIEQAPGEFCAMAADFPPHGTTRILKANARNAARFTLGRGPLPRSPWRENAVTTPSLRSCCGRCSRPSWRARPHVIAVATISRSAGAGPRAPRPREARPAAACARTRSAASAAAPPGAGYAFGRSSHAARGRAR